LQQCLDLFSKREQLDDYQCDHCKAVTPAIVDTKISRAPDILIVHLKRFSYQSGFLEKIEDLVNFPLRNLDLSQTLSAGIKKHAKTSKPNSQLYDLYAIVNHIMYHTAGGGHYTTYVASDTQHSGQKAQIWLKCNDSTVSRIDKEDLVSKDAYILFYKRKEFTASNIINFASAGY